jgi:hypothetical protein
MKYTTSLIAVSLLLLNEVDSFSTSSNTQQFATQSLLFHRRTTPGGEGHINNKKPFQSRSTLTTPAILPHRRTTTTSLSMSPVPVGAIAGALTGGLLGGALHAIAGKSNFFLFSLSSFRTDRQTNFT